MTGRWRRAATVRRRRSPATSASGESIRTLSSARRRLRTRQTLELVADGLPAHRASRVELVPGIYEASGADLLAIVRRLPDEVSTAMLIGHQPGIQDLALTLVGAGPGLARISGKFPTAALATVAVASAWNELGPGSGRLLDVAKPKQLQG